MGGQSAAESDHLPGRVMHRYGDSRSVLADGNGGRGERISGNRFGYPTPGSGGGGSLGAAQQRWPEYNRVVYWTTGAIVVGAAAISVVLEVVH